MVSNAERAGDLAVREALAGFMKGFEPLNTSVLASRLAPNVTAFLPFAPRRIEGREAVKAAFEHFFSGLSRELPEPPSLRLVPERLEIQVISGVAIASFELEHQGSVGRRTLTFANQDGNWRIIHVHASEYESS